MNCLRVCLLSLSCLSAIAFAASTPLVGHYSNRPLVIDGKLDEPAWQMAPKYSDFLIMQTDQTARRRTEVQIVYTDTAVVIGFTAYIPLDLLPTPEEALKAKVYSTDCVELMIDPSGGSDSYFHLIVNSVNMRLLHQREQGGYVGTTWRADWNSAVQREQNFWSAEIEIPYRSLEVSPNDGKLWSFNAVRESYQLPEVGTEVSSLAKRGVTHTAESFRKLQAPELDLSAYHWQIGQPSQQQNLIDGLLQVSLSCRVDNQSRQGQEVKIEAAYTGKDGFLAQSEIVTTLPAGSAREVQLPALRLPKSGLYQGSITIRQREQNRILARRRFESEVTFVPMQIKLLDPHYRQAIFATQNLEQVRYQVVINQNLGKDAWQLRSGIRSSDGKQIVCEDKIVAKKEQEFAFSATQLPEGRWEVFAELLNPGQEKPEVTTVSLRKLPYQKNEVWYGKDGNWYVDGKKIFLLSSWSTGEVSRRGGYNVILRSPNSDDPLMYFSTATGFGLRAVKNRLKAEGPTPEILEIYRERVRLAKNDPQLFAHYLVDEPDCAGFAGDAFDRIAEAMADEDPYHPIVISTGSAGILSYLNCGEINGFHCYPRPVQGKPMSNFRKIVILMDKWRAHWNGEVPQQSMAYLHQGFNYGDSGLRDSRIPSYEEYRNQNILALILGSIGLMHYNRCELQYPELYLGIPHLVAEQKIIGEEAVIHPSPASVPVANSSDLRLLGKANPDGTYWLLACNASEDEAEYEINWPLLGDKPVQVLSENRQPQITNGRFRDRFTPFQARVYTTSKQNFGLMAIEQVNALIEKEYAARVKPGNLAHQRFEGEKVLIRASSNKFAARGYAENCLWHVADGVCDGLPAKSGHADGVVTYHDNTPNETPDWLEMEFQQPITAGKVVLYPVENSLLEYEIQAWLNDQYVTVAKIENADGNEQVVNFKPVQTKMLRLWVTANRGPDTRLYEWEVYEK